MYNGEWLDGARSGKGCLTTSCPSEYNGDWAHGRRHGSGRQTYPSGNVYEGQWQNDMKSGFGIFKWLNQNQVYEGEWRFDRPDGVGCYVWFRSHPGVELSKMKSLSEQNDEIHFCNRYQGEFKNGLRHGQGVFSYSNGALYKGGWAHNRKHGPGMFIHVDGHVEKGIWDQDRIESSSDHEQTATDTGPTSLLGTQVQCEDLVPLKSQPGSNEQISTVLLRYNDDLRRIIVFYGSEEGQAVPRLKLSSIWTWIRDCNLRSAYLTRAQISIMTANELATSLPVYDGRRVLLFRECHELLVRIGALVYADRAADQVSEALNALIQEVILPRFEQCTNAISNNQVRSSVDVMMRMAPFECQLKSLFEQHKDKVTSAMPSRVLFRLLEQNRVPSETILNSFNETYRCDLTENHEIVIKAVDIAIDEVLYEEMVEIVGRSVTSISLSTQDTAFDFADWIESLGR